jgi:hypothetical protein
MGGEDRQGRLLDFDEAQPDGAEVFLERLLNLLAKRLSLEIWLKGWRRSGCSRCRSVSGGNVRAGR